MASSRVREKTRERGHWERRRGGNEVGGRTPAPRCPSVVHSIPAALTAPVTAARWRCVDDVFWPAPSLPVRFLPFLGTLPWPSLVWVTEERRWSLCTRGTHCTVAAALYTWRPILSRFSILAQIAPGEVDLLLHSWSLAERVITAPVPLCLCLFFTDVRALGRTVLAYWCSDPSDVTETIDIISLQCEDVPPHTLRLQHQKWVACTAPRRQQCAVHINLKKPAAAASAAALVTFLLWDDVMWD